VAGEFAIHSFAETDNTVKALDLTLQTLERLHRERMTGEMLESARAYVLGQYPLNFETAADWAAALGEIELFGLGPEYIDNYGPALRNVTPADARHVVEDAFPTPDSVAIVLIGDAAKIRDQVRRYGPVTDMSLIQPAFEPARRTLAAA
jgi:predicted Zn-dependent peptidase